MPAEEKHAPHREREPRDVNFRGAYIFGVILLLTLVVIIFGMRAVFWHFAKVQALGPEATPFATSRELPPAPRLQAQPKEDLQQTLASQRALLESYGWVDQSAGKVRIPIDRAMDLLLQRGLPVRPQPPASNARTNAPAAPKSSKPGKPL